MAASAGAQLERRSSVRRTQGMAQEEERGQTADEEIMLRSQGGNTEPAGGSAKVVAALDKDSAAPKSREQSAGPSEMDQMKEKFAKLLLGEDMSGSGKGVPSALALSNAVTNLAASVFGEQRKLEPMAADRKARWKREVGWLLSVADHIVEFVAKKQVLDNGTEMEVMGTQQRRDLQANIPALRKLDTMLLDYLDNFKERTEFWYVKRDSCSESENEGSQRSDEKWWIPIVKVPPAGLSKPSRGWLLHQKELVNQVLKAAMAINANCLMEMSIPDTYIDTLPKNGRASLGDALYRIITDVEFDPDDFLSTVDLTSEHKILDLKDRIEASVIIWNRKVHNKDGKSSWGSAVSQEKREQFEERAQTLLLIIKHRFPGIPQSTLDIAKIQENRDVGFALLESYSRVLESLAFNVMSRIEDVIQADNVAREKAKRDAPAEAAGRRDPQNGGEDGGTTLLDFMGWTGDSEGRNDDCSPPPPPELPAQDDGRLMKLPNIMTNLKQTYMDKLDFLSGNRSPSARH
ncbi:hypothetical protein GQ55_5G151100 [Panicum hallii var. hallii]|uniref:PRONE domain-containing protein n=3 Tax=Panicum hallii TaxID=206008 RepID=A0A2T7DGH0_9POAL|nr:rop guanine nucleotide exchange factor 9-like isoform X2 [Panicum hallii]PAN28409.1 hypothetical protein PAHAL_5G151200 [Panicum hallii]PUZ54679.1 hypothetical protein GQ55_5G151100 [Panicum hallii var. hallii]PUZ54680.1 hypothetical protein GQ55_5G151100 [Panicum hallii var. hallii]PUZ54681.1 hypothetical protein GQ55_5G151100 [Panicum hallii var. hallii]